MIAFWPTKSVMPWDRVSTVYNDYQMSFWSKMDQQGSMLFQCKKCDCYVGDPQWHDKEACLNIRQTYKVGE